MSFLRSLLGRRQFLFVSFGGAAALVFKRLARVLDLFFRGSTARASGPSEAAGRKALKACVVYYSATGSTGKVAGAIYHGIKSVMPCDVAPINKMDPEKMAQYDVVAVGGAHLVLPGDSQCPAVPLSYAPDGWKILHSLLQPRFTASGLHVVYFPDDR